MKYLLYFALGALALLLADALWQMVVGTPEVVECDGGMENTTPVWAYN